MQESANTAMRTITLSTYTRLSTNEEIWENTKQQKEGRAAGFLSLDRTSSYIIVCRWIFLPSCAPVLKGNADEALVKFIT